MIRDESLGSGREYGYETVGNKHYKDRIKNYNNSSVFIELKLKLLILGVYLAILLVEEAMA